MVLGVGGGGFMFVIILFRAFHAINAVCLKLTTQCGSIRPEQMGTWLKSTHSNTYDAGVDMLTDEHMIKLLTRAAHSFLFVTVAHTFRRTHTHTTEAWCGGEQWWNLWTHKSNSYVHIGNDSHLHFLNSVCFSTDCRLILFYLPTWFLTHSFIWVWQPQTIQFIYCKRTRTFCLFVCCLLLLLLLLLMLLVMVAVLTADAADYFFQLIFWTNEYIFVRYWEQARILNKYYKFEYVHIFCIAFKSSRYVMPLPARRKNGK